MRHAMRKSINALLLLISVCFYTNAGQENETLPAQAGNTSPLLELGQTLSNHDATVTNRLTLFINSRAQYFKHYEDSLWDRGIDAAQLVTPVIALVESLIDSKSVVYRDFSSPADLVLLKLNQLVNGQLNKHTCFKDLQTTYKNTKQYNAIGNFLYNDKLGPTPMNCLQNVGYSLATIDEGSDAFAFILVAKDKQKQITTLAKQSNITIKWF